MPSTGSHADRLAPDRSNEASTSAGAEGDSSAVGVMVADLPVGLFLNDEALAAAALELFSPMAAHAGPYAATILFDRNIPSRPPRNADEKYGSLSLWRDGDQLIVDSDAPLRAVVGRTSAVIGGVVEDPFSGTTMLRRIAHHVLAHMLSLNERLVVHGAAVGRSAEAVLLLGRSGAGKSTSAYLASIAGWALLGDDLVVITRDDERLHVTGIHRAIAVPHEIVGADAREIYRDGRGRRQPTVTLDGRTLPVAAVAIVEHGLREGSVHRISGAEMARFFLGSAPAAGNTTVAAIALRTAGQLARLPCFELALPADPVRRVSDTAELFDEIAAETTTQLRSADSSEVHE